MKRKIYFLFTIFFVSCGIPQFFYLEEPIIKQKAHSTSEFALFLNNLHNKNSYFVGFNIYYKLFKTHTQLENTVGRIKNENRNYLMRLKFQKLYRIEKKIDNSGYKVHTGHTFPVHKDNRKKEFCIKIDFMDDQIANELDFNTYIGYLINADEITDKKYLCRFPIQNRKNFQENKREPRSFAPDNFTVDDGDLPNKVKNNRVYMALYVCCVGCDPNAIMIYSKPLYLGECELEIKEGVFND